LRHASFLKDDDDGFEANQTEMGATQRPSRWSSRMSIRIDLVPKISAALMAGAGRILVMLQYKHASSVRRQAAGRQRRSLKSRQRGRGYSRFPGYSFTASGQWKACRGYFATNAIVLPHRLLAGVGETKFPDTFEEANRVSKPDPRRSTTPPGGRLGRTASVIQPNMAYPLMWAYGGAEVTRAGRRS